MLCPLDVKKVCNEHCPWFIEGCAIVKIAKELAIIANSQRK